MVHVSAGQRPLRAGHRRVIRARVCARRSTWLRLTVLVLLIAIAVVVAVAVGVPDAQQLRADVAAVGPAAPVLFVLVYAVASLAPVPKNVFSVAAGLLFGLGEGTGIVLLAALLGALAAFALGRALGREAVERMTGGRVARVDALLGRHGFLAVLGVRLVPVLPFTAINYAAGLTAVRLGDYVLGTAVGILPGTVAHVALGAYGTSPGSWPFVAAVLGLVALTAGGAAAVHRHRRKGATPGAQRATAGSAQSGEG
ncbi:TVP38/TMEM64 family protein [Modestobacter sp. VKM Ac-2984]|nr:TVP38/TMEM64 family protein [Modestobacter sp. VKM Ac-2984]